MKNQIRITESATPRGGATIYRADFRTMSLTQLEEHLQDTLLSYARAGYNTFCFHRATATVSILKDASLTPQAIQEIINTQDNNRLNDAYGAAIDGRSKAVKEHSYADILVYDDLITQIVTRQF